MTWNVGLSSHKGTGACNAFCTQDSSCPISRTEKKWMVFDGKCLYLKPDFGVRCAEKTSKPNIDQVAVANPGKLSTVIEAKQVLMSPTKSIGVFGFYLNVISEYGKGVKKKLQPINEY